MQNKTTNKRKKAIMKYRKDRNRYLDRMEDCSLAYIAGFEACMEENGIKPYVFDVDIATIRRIVKKEYLDPKKWYDWHTRPPFGDTSKYI